LCTRRRTSILIASRKYKPYSPSGGPLTRDHLEYEYSRIHFGGQPAAQLALAAALDASAAAFAMPRIGVISDTHGLLRTEAVAFLRGSDLIIHGGDIGHAGTLEGLASLAPV